MNIPTDQFIFSVSNYSSTNHDLGLGFKDNQIIGYVEEFGWNYSSNILNLGWLFVSYHPQTGKISYSHQYGSISSIYIQSTGLDFNLGSGSFQAYGCYVFVGGPSSSFSFDSGFIHSAHFYPSSLTDT